MKRVISCVSACIILSALICSSAVAVQYRVINCGALDGAIYTSSGGLSVGWSINNQGQVVGCSNDSRGQQHAIIWDIINGIRPMTLDGGLITGGYEINNNGVALVDASRLWNGPDKPFTGLSPYGLNDKEQVVGEIAVNGKGHAALWDATNGIKDLGIPDGAGSSWAIGINNVGQVLVDTIAWPGGYHTYIWDKANGFRDLGLLAGNEQSVPIGINDKGEVIGYMIHHVNSPYLRTITYFIWSESDGLRSLGTLGLPADCGVSAINNKSQIIGGSPSGSYVWDNANGMTILPTLGGLYSHPYDINDNGWVTGSSTDVNGNSYACVWVPVPEPSSFAGILLGVSFIRMLRGKR